jgi:uncharacterized protein
MRSFQLLFLLLFFVFFNVLAFGAILNLKTIASKKIFRIFRPAFWILHTGVLLMFLFLYVYPHQPREASNYPLYFYFNIVLLTLFIFNLPMSASYLLHIFSGRKNKSPVIPLCGIILSAGLTTGMIYGTIWGSQQLKTEKTEIHYNNLPPDFDGFRIVQISDTHFGGMIRPGKLIAGTKKIIDEIRPDVILFTGDLVNNFAGELDGLQQKLSALTQDYESFAIRGNHDYGDYTDWKNTEEKQANFDGILEAFRNSGFHLLRNENAWIKKGNDSIFLAGVENWGHAPFPQYADLNAAIEGIPDGAFTILMTHDPAHWESQVARKKEIELTLAGHTHGLQWGIKLAGIPFSLAQFIRKTWGGLYGEGNSLLYVNTGLGTVGMPWRLDMPGEVTVITLKRSEID